MSPEKLNDPETYVHHTAGNPHPNWAPEVAMRELQSFSHNKGYATVAYDVVCHMGSDGVFTIMEGRGAGRSAATMDRNEEGEAICMMGYFHPGNKLSDRPQPREIEGLAWGIAWMVEQGWSARDTKILGHRDNPAHLNATTCPGNLLYEELPVIRRRVDQILNPTPITPPAPPTRPPFTQQEVGNMKLITPTRVADTRSGAMTTRVEIPIAGNVVAITATVTVIPQAHGGFLSGFPGTSCLNWGDNRDAIANTTVLPVTNGKVTLNASTPVHIIVDMLGTHSPTS